MAADDNCSGWRTAARAIGLVRAGVALRIVCLIGGVVELWFGAYRDALRVVIVTTAVMLVCDVIAAAGAGVFALRAPVRGRSAALAATALLACAALDAWGLVWLTDTVAVAGRVLVHGMAVCSLAAALAVLSAANATLLGIDPGAPRTSVVGARWLLGAGTVLFELGVPQRNDLGLLLVLAALPVLLAGAIAYVAALGRVRAALLAHAPVPPAARALAR
jgi:hypothetical protein